MKTIVTVSSLLVTLLATLPGASACEATDPTGQTDTCLLSSYEYQYGDCESDYGYEYSATHSHVRSEAGPAYLATSEGCHTYGDYQTEWNGVYVYAYPEDNGYAAASVSDTRGDCETAGSDSTGASGYHYSSDRRASVSYSEGCYGWGGYGYDWQNANVHVYDYETGHYVSVSSYEYAYGDYEYCHQYVSSSVTDRQPVDCLPEI